MNQRISIVFFVLSLFSSCSSQKVVVALDPVHGGKFSILQGPSLNGTAQFSIALPSGAKPFFQVVDNKGREVSSLIVRSYWFDGNEMVSLLGPGDVERNRYLHLKVSGLMKGELYFLKIGKDTRRFRLSRTGRKLFKFAVLSCMADYYQKEQIQMWSQVKKLKPHALFMIGDNVYGDREKSGGKILKTSPEILWRRYWETRHTLDVFFWDSLVPVFATWDDHDYGDNDGGRKFTHKNFSQNLFRAYFAQNELASSYGPGISSHWDLGEHRLIFLDNRSYRDEGKKNLQGYHFGDLQTAWMSNILMGRRKKTFLISGDQFFGAYHPYESFEGRHPERFKFFINELISSRSPVAFISGDRHLSEVMKISKQEFGLETIEITSSPIHAKVYPGSFAKDPNPRQKVGVDGIFNFVIVGSTGTPSSWNLKSESFGINGESLFKDFSIIKP